MGRILLRSVASSLDCLLHRYHGWLTLCYGWLKLFVSSFFLYDTRIYSIDPFSTPD